MAEFIDNIGYLIPATVIVLLIASVVWAYGDAKNRGKSPVAVALLVAFVAWPMGLLAWLVFRPDSDTGSRKRFDLEDYRQQ